MRVALFVSALFAVSMTTGAALAERSADGGARPSREHRVHELRQRDARPVAAKVAAPKGETKVAPKGELLVQKKAAEARRCSETGADCPNKGAKNARVKEAQSKGERSDKHASSAAERRRMKDAMAKVWRALCEKRASSCADAL